MSVTQPIIPDEPRRGTVESYRARLSSASSVIDLHSRSLGLIRAALFGGEPADQVQRIENILAVTDELTVTLLDHALADAVPVHYLEPGVDGDDDDRMACGERFGDAVKTGEFTGVEADVTCQACRASAQLDHTQACRDQLEERPCRFDCEARS